MLHRRLNFFFLNIGHLYDHLFVLIFATVAALSLSKNWGLTYDELIPYATPGFIALAYALSQLACLQINGADKA